MSAKKILIIGNGVAGVTAARTLRRLGSKDEITLISAESDHFFSRTALMYIYMGHMPYENTKPYEDWFWAKHSIGLLRARVTRVDPVAKQVHLESGAPLGYDALVLASGSKSNKFGWPGQDLPGVQALYSLQDLELLEANTADGRVRRAVVVGGGLIGIELTEMLLTRGIPVTFLLREPSWMNFAYPPEESAMIGRHILEHGIDLRFGTEIDRILPGQDGRARAVVTKSGEEIPCELVGLTVGVGPNVDFLKDSGIELGRGVLVDEQLRTNFPEVFAIGDCAELRQARPGRRPVEPLWYVGRRMGETVGYSLAGKPTPYDPGTWFNSAKFLDLEWQVYGQVPAQPAAGEETLYWEHPAGKLALRINYRSPDGPVLGFQVMGIRYRHEVCQEWLEAGRPIRWVLENLGVANFDPELYRQYESELIAVFNRRHPENPVTLKRKRGLRGLFELRRAS